MTPGIDATGRPQYLAFSVAEADYAVPILKVREILKFEEPTPIPGAPATVRGVLNLRGEAVPVHDLRRRFGLGATSVSRTTCVLVLDAVVERRSTRLGVLADAVRAVLDVAPEEIEPPPPGARIESGWLTGLARLERGFCLLLDIDRVLSDQPGALGASALAPADPAALAGA